LEGKQKVNLGGTRKRENAAIPSLDKIAIAADVAIGIDAGSPPDDPRAAAIAHDDWKNIAVGEQNVDVGPDPALAWHRKSTPPPSEPSFHPH
jgi:hypothetical protein